MTQGYAVKKETHCTARDDVGRANLEYTNYGGHTTKIGYLSLKIYENNKVTVKKK